MQDVLDLVPEKEIKCLDHGFTRLIDAMPRIVEDGQTADSRIVQAARVSYGPGTKTVNKDRGLIRFLIRHNHGTPLEKVVFEFHLKLPIFVARQLMRHRVVSFNEISGRYSVLPNEFYIPDEVRQQSKSNKQGGNNAVAQTEAEDFVYHLKENCKKSYDSYERALDYGVSRELARFNLPVNLYTEFYMTINLRGLFNFLGLRCDSHAQYEIRVFADAIYKLVKPLCPFSIEAFEDYHPMRGAENFTRLELEALSKMIKHMDMKEIDTDNKREQEEWIAKMQKLGAFHG